jgi:hypothetical protein
MALHAAAFGALVGALAALFAWWITRPARQPTDFEFWWRAARLLSAGTDPYAMRPHTAAWPLIDRLFYPGPALIVALPFAPLPLRAAFVAWSGLGGGTLAWALRRDGRSALPVLLSAPLVMALRLGQWSPFVTAAALVPALGFLLAAKPTIGAALFAARPSRRAFAGVLLVLAASVAWLPSWPLAWLDNLRSVVGHPPPVATPLGAVVLLAVLRWRRPEARLLLAYACVPQLLLFADQLPLLLVARRRVDALLLWGASWLAFAYWFLPIAKDWAPGAVASASPYVLLGVYWPALALVLREPNAGPVHPSVEAWVGRMRIPAWLRGAPSGP